MIFVDTPVPEVRATSQKSEIVPGRLCWAKLSRYPWWPALVIERQDQRIPQSEWRSTQTATPVLFFGTAEFSWIDASRNVSPWETEKLSRAVKDKSPEFKRALQEATVYINSGNLPQSFSLEELQNRDSSEGEPDSPHAKPTPLSHRKSTYPLLMGEELLLSGRDRRRLSVQRQLGLAPPWNSPAATQPMLNRNLASVTLPAAPNPASTLPTSNPHQRPQTYG
eukprot:jgi/Ulvmu1/1553/UM110_0016.1